MRMIREMRNESKMVNEQQSWEAEDIPGAPQHQGRLTRTMMQEQLGLREENMRRSPDADEHSTIAPITDQWRIYEEIVGCLRSEAPAHIFVQASAGAGKSYLLESVCLWCLLHGLTFKACAPTGIAAANITVEGTDVTAATMHSLFGLDAEYGTKIDFSKLRDPKVQALLSMRVLLIDEVSMMDIECWSVVKRIVREVRKRTYEPVHIIMFGDFKQLPPATSKAPFIVDPEMHVCFAFRVLRENRRVLRDQSRREELDAYHSILDDMGHGRASTRVKQYVVEAFVRGALAKKQTADLVDIEGFTSIFAKRRYRDRFNRTIIGRIARASNHELKIKGVVLARHAVGHERFNKRTAEMVRKTARTQALWNLRLAGDWHPDYESKLLPGTGSLKRWAKYRWRQGPSESHSWDGLS